MNEWNLEIRTATRGGSKGWQEAMAPCEKSASPIGPNGHK